MHKAFYFYSFGICTVKVIDSWKASALAPKFITVTKVVINGLTWATGHWYLLVLSMYGTAVPCRLGRFTENSTFPIRTNIPVLGIKETYKTEW